MTVERARPRRAERGVRVAEPRGHARARPRRGEGERQRRRDRDRAPARDERRPARRRRCSTSSAAAAGATASRRCASASARARRRCSSARRLVMRTQVAIVGAGPAGLTLAQLLASRGDRVGRAREPEPRVRRAPGSAPGVLEQGVVDLLADAGVGERMEREGLVHHGIELQFDGRAATGSRMSELTGGKHDHDLRPDGGRQGPDRGAARSRRGRSCSRSTTSALHDLESRAAAGPLHARGASSRRSSATSSPAATASTASAAPSIPAGVLRTFEREYPFGWLGILAAVAPSSDELVYAHHERGFALLSLRSPELSRLYVQCRPDEDIAELARRADLGGAAGPARLDDGWTLARGPGAREGDHGDAQLRRRADAARPALPRRRRRPHRAADRREGPEPRGRAT